MAPHPTARRRSLQRLLHGMCCTPTEGRQMTDSEVMARLRHELLNTMYNSYPTPLTKQYLMSECQTAFLTRDKDWYSDAVVEQLKVLGHAGLVRPMHGGYTLTERGRRDRQQAARFFSSNPPPPKDAA